MKDMNGIKIIAVDHGYGNIKTANHCFSTGIVGSDTEPLFTGDMLVYEGRYYLIGERHKEFLPDKIMDDDYYVTPAAFEGGLNEEEAGGINLQPQMEAAVEHFTPVSGTESSVPADTQPVEPPTQETPQQETNREPTNPLRNDAPREQREVLPAQQNDQLDMQEQPQIEERPNTDESQPSWESGQPLEQEQPQRGEEMQEQPQQGNDRQEQIPQGNEQPQETDQTGNAPSPLGDQPNIQDGDVSEPPDSGNGPMTFAPHGNMRNFGEHDVHGRKGMGPDEEKGDAVLSKIAVPN